MGNKKNRLSGIARSPGWPDFASNQASRAPANMLAHRPIKMYNGSKIHSIKDMSGQFWI